MEHQGTKMLESDKLILRRFRIDDAQAMYENWANDSEVTKYLPWTTHETVGMSKNVINDWVSQYCKDDFYQWAITVKENGDFPIGSISVVYKQDRLKMVHIGYCIGRQWWNQGITSDALSLIIYYLFDEVKVNRIEAIHDPKNPSAGKVMLKCGLKYEGTQREASWNNQGLCDASLYAILAKDFYTAK